MAIHQPETLPWLGFFDKLRQSDIFVLLDSVQFSKHYFQNRNRIRTATADRWSWLTIPVFSKGRSRQAIWEVEIDRHRPDWARKHVALLRQSYREAPWFEATFPSLEALYAQEWSKLVDFNVAVIRWMAQCLGLERPLLRSSDLGVAGYRSELLVSICQEVGATEYLSGVSGRHYLDVALFDAAGIRVRFQEFYHPIYPQCHQPFVPALSAVDLLFNCGGNSRHILEGRGVLRVPEVFE